MNDNSSINSSRKNFLLNFIERKIDRLKRSVGKSQVKLESKVSAGQESGHTNPYFFHGGSVDFSFGHQAGTVAIAKAGPAGQKRVAVRNRGVSVKGNGRDVQLLRLTTKIEGFDILQNVGEFVATQVHQIFCHGVKHEGIVRIGAMAQGKFHVSNGSEGE
jgi:hypothetical protein